ncbi:MAG: GNAT family N-acetyltransferase [Lachnospiraceae bacterium]|nr:GNAT family N-acetyltransferase [Lachnospiraceae bacterium]MDD3615224.1 GNAT family N-acetyltransferase [Lachnospiraceae bacterium]
MENNRNIRIAKETDAEALLEIYKPYVLNTAISFEYEVPSVAEFQNRIHNILQRYPYLILEESGQIKGYAYASSFKPRPAYDWSVETTIYMREDQKGKGYGKQLYLALEEALKRQNILNMNACIALAKPDDPYLTNASMEFHEHMGYRLVGTFTNSGHKFHRWYDMIWMEKIIGEHRENPAKVIAFPFI